MSEREWVVHSLGLCRERVKKFNARHEAVDDPMAYFRRLKWELDWREYVWKMVVAGRVGELSVVGRVWWEYMKGHAQAQVERHAGRMDEEMFRKRAEHLRRKREIRLANIRERVA
ncbi:MAG: hypothetical protein RIC84_08670 [Aggregatilineales bacterium]